MKIGPPLVLPLLRRRGRITEDHDRDGDPGFCEDPDIYIEFDDGVFYQASLDGSKMAITADYPRPYPFSIVSI